MSTKSTSKGKRMSLQWTEPMDQILVDALLHQVIKGNRVNGQFTTIAFDEVVDEVCSKTQMESIDKDKVKNRIKTLKKTFGEAYDFSKDLNMFEWNPVTKLFEADSVVWNELIKSNPSAIQWKTRSIFQYDKLKDLWGKEKVGGEDESIKENSNACCLNQDGSSSKTRVGSSTKKRRIEEAITMEIDRIKNVMERVVDVLATGNSILERTRPRVYSEEEVYAELERMKLDDVVILQAYDYLTSNQARVRCMFGLPWHLRKKWLFRKLYGTS